jgi:hypothetical protein
MKANTSDVQTITSNYDDVAQGGGGSSSGGSPNANSGGEDVHTTAYTPGKPSMAGSSGSELNPGFEGDVAESGGMLSTRVMEGGVDFTWPGDAQGNLEPVGDGSAKGS